LMNRPLEDDGITSSADTSPTMRIDAPAPLAGRVVGTYQLQYLIGAGGMGEVYKAHDTKLDRADDAGRIAPLLAIGPPAIRRHESS